MITYYCTVICFVMIYIILITIYSKLIAMDRLYNSWRAHCLHHDKLLNDIDIRREGDLLELDKALERIQDLEDRLEAHAAELTEHHNKIDTLETNGSVYESLFEQQGLWGDKKE